MNIGFDLDKVLINYPPLLPDYLFDRFYKKKTDGKLLYRIPKKPEQILRTALHHPLLRPAIKTNIEILKSHANDTDKKYFLISSRFGFLQKRTEELTKRHNLSLLFKALYFNYDNKQPHIFKNEMIKKLHIDRFVDDDLKLIEYLAHENPQVMFYWLNKKESKKLKKNLLAITDIATIFK